MNEVIYEIVYVADGNGQFIPKDSESIVLRQGDVISIIAGQKYAWDGHMTLITAYTPPFDPNQHKQVEEIV